MYIKSINNIIKSDKNSNNYYNKFSNIKFMKLPCSGNSKEMSGQTTKAININNNDKSNSNNHNATTTKTLPKPILKKPKESTSLNNYGTNLTSPKFYSGNELKFSSYVDTIKYHDTDHQHNYSDTNGLLNKSNDEQLVDVEKEELKDQFIDQINFSHINLNYYKDHYKHEDRFTESSLVKSMSSKNKNKRKRTQSDVYLYHSRDINKEIIKMLIQSTDSFIRDFKSKNQCPYVNDADLMKSFKNKFVSSLKDFLTYGSDRYYDKSHHLDIGVALSEPLISEIEDCRIKSEKEYKLTPSHSESLFYQNFFTNSIDSSGNITNETNHIYGSLPTASFFDLYTPKASIQCRFSIDGSSNTVTKKVNSTVGLVANNKAKNLVNEASTNKKIVRFADSFGLELEKVKMITNNSFVDAFSFSNEYDNENDPFKSKSNKDLEDESSNSAMQSKPFLVLIPLFGLRKQEAIVRLDDYVYDYENKLIRCIIKVRNLHYVKRVFARITFNNWKTHYDMDAMYIKSDPPPFTPVTQLQHFHSHGSSSNFSSASSSSVLHSHARPYNYDYFGFCILLPEKNEPPKPSISENNSSKSGPTLAFDDCTLRVEFAICYEWDNAKNTTWDNNSGENYKFQCFYNK